MTDRRRFNTLERVDLFVASDGHCSDCGRELEPGWHADHLIPYSKGGATVLSNGAAKCPACNLKKGTSMTNVSPPLRQWQAEFTADFRASTQRHYLLHACPAAGKTAASIDVARNFDRIVVVAPQTEVRKNWTRAFGRAGRRVHPLSTGNFPIARDCAVAALTYQWMIGHADYPRLTANWLRAGRESLLILDEVHHLADGDDGPGLWADPIVKVADAATRTLMLTGTPFRTDGRAIPLVRFDQNGNLRIDHSYGFADAWRERPRPIRTVRFYPHDGDAVTSDGRVRVSLADASDDDEAIALWGAIDDEGDVVTKMLTDIERQLQDRRRLRPRAAALIVCRDQDHARDIARRIQQLGLERNPAVIVSDLPRTTELIDQFRDGTGKFVVAVRQISEGVDIPRLEVLGLLMTYRTELFFHQVVGRVLRVIPADGDVEAAVHFPNIPRFSAYVAGLMAEQSYALKEVTDNGDGGEIGEPAERQALDVTSENAAQGAILRPGGASIDRLLVNGVLAERPDFPEDTAIAVVEWAVAHGATDLIDRAEPAAPTIDVNARHDALRKKLDDDSRRAVNAMVGDYRSEYGTKMREFNIAIARHVGATLGRDDWTTAQLERAIEFVRRYAP